MAAAVHGILSTPTLTRIHAGWSQFRGGPTIEGQSSGNFINQGLDISADQCVICVFLYYITGVHVALGTLGVRQAKRWRPFPLIIMIWHYSVMIRLCS